MGDVIDFSAGDFVHLGLGSTVVALPTHTGDMAWYEEYEISHGHDGAEGRLVSMHTFTQSWDSWEMHPTGAELVLCVAGTVTLIQESHDGSSSDVTICAGQATVNPPGVWHTADVPDDADPPTVVFITAGAGTEHRAR